MASTTPISADADSAPEAGPIARTRRMWRLLAGFWCVMLVAIGSGAGMLQYLGAPAPSLAPAVAAVSPPRSPSVAVSDEPQSPPVQAAPQRAELPAPVPAVVAHAEPAHTPPVPNTQEKSQAAEPAAVEPGAIAALDPKLLEASAQYPGGRMPRIGADRRTPMQVYAAGFDKADPRPRVAILMAGLGMNEAESAIAIGGLPPAVSLAISPYAARLEKTVERARAAGHETLLSLPMEPQGFPLNDPGNRALLTGASQAANAQLLEWALTRFGGYVGVTGALGDMRGERFAAASDQMGAVLDTLADRGLLYVDPRPNAIRGRGAAARGAYRGIDIVIDDPAGAVALDQALARLEQVARDRGGALGLAGRASPVTIDRIAAWAVGLSGRGVALAPVSVVVQMPQLSFMQPAARMKP